MTDWIKHDGLGIPKPPSRDHSIEVTFINGLSVKCRRKWKDGKLWWQGTSLHREAWFDRGSDYDIASYRFAVDT